MHVDTVAYGYMSYRHIRKDILTGTRIKMIDHFGHTDDCFYPILYLVSFRHLIHWHLDLNPLANEQSYNSIDGRRTCP